mmetsp:Transcript_5277/g.13502  ORF Transcript_5277/g.13502 Transcript_5277/m.13502 type:complete len:329 (+) Transcript_5277:182-1168(+)
MAPLCRTVGVGRWVVCPTRAARMQTQGTAHRTQPPPPPPPPHTAARSLERSRSALDGSPEAPCPTHPRHSAHSGRSSRPAARRRRRCRCLRWAPQCGGGGGEDTRGRRGARARDRAARGGRGFDRRDRRGGGAPGRAHAPARGGEAVAAGRDGALQPGENARRVRRLARREATRSPRLLPPSLRRCTRASCAWSWRVPSGMIATKLPARGVGGGSGGATSGAARFASPSPALGVVCTGAGGDGRAYSCTPGAARSSLSREMRSTTTVCYRGHAGGGRGQAARARVADMRLKIERLVRTFEAAQARTSGGSAWRRRQRRAARGGTREFC